MLRILSFAPALALVLAVALLPMSSHAESVPSNDGTETPKFEVLASGPDGIQVRRYEPMIEAYTTVEASDARAASNKAFMTVAGYIFGGNEGASKIDMTAPVETTSGTKIDMTAPVETTSTDSLNEDGSYTIAFMMPSKWTMETLPKPADDAVKLREVPSTTKAAIFFKGERDTQDIAELETKLRDWLGKSDWTVQGPASLNGYDGPRVASAERRYEVHIPVAAK